MLSLSLGAAIASVNERIAGCKNCEASEAIISYMEFVTMTALQSLEALNLVTFRYGDNTLLCCAVVRIVYFYQSQD